MKPVKRKAPSKAKKTVKKPTYTHRDGSGMGWRFVGSRPVSALADKVMADCGMPLR